MSRELSAGSSDEGKLLEREARRCANEQSLGGRRRRQGVSLGSHVLDASGTELLSRKVENDEADIARLIDETLSLAERIVWAVDQPGGSAALLLALLWERNQRVFYVPGLSVDRARDTYRGESKTDARDAHVIAYPRRA
jgi:transposase